MSANLTESAPQEAAMASASFNVQKIYLKDVSFEAPNTPMVFSEQGQPELNMGLNQKVQMAQTVLVRIYTSTMRLI